MVVMWSLLSGQQAKKEPTSSRLSRNTKTINGLAVLGRHAEQVLLD
jgi:hypothetical protein